MVIILILLHGKFGVNYLDKINNKKKKKNKKKN